MTTPKRRNYNGYVPPGRNSFLPVPRQNFTKVAQRAGFTAISKQKVDAMGAVGRYLVEQVGAENLGVAYVARSHELTEKISEECDSLIAKCESDEQKIEVLKLFQVSARQLADNGKMLIASEHLAVQSMATIAETNRSAPPGEIAVPNQADPGITVEVEANSSSSP
jgi:hypothetical protein